MRTMCVVAMIDAMPSPHSETFRLEAFSDATFAILITIMVLEFKIPHESTLSALVPLAPIFLSYVLSFVYLAIYWNNHHHLLHATEDISGGVMWANMHLLFWLSLVPFVTGWVGENPSSIAPAVLYGFVLLLCGAAYSILQNAIIQNEGKGSKLAKAVGKDWKGKASLALYAVAILGALIQPWIAYTLFAAVALIWIVPDKRLTPMFDHLDD